MYYIYELTSPSGAVYIGQTNDIQRRWEKYRNKNKSVKEQPALWNALNKYPNFRDWTTRVLYTYQTKQAVDIAEKILIKLNKMKGIYSYNIAAGGDGVGSGVEHPNYDHSRKYGVNCCEDPVAYHRAYYAAHREERKAYYRKHCEERREQQKVYRREHHEDYLEKQKGYDEELRLILKTNNLTNGEWRALSKEQWAHLKEVYRNGIPS